MLSAKLADAEEKLAGYSDLKASEEKLKKQLSDMQHRDDMSQAELANFKEKYQEVNDSLKISNESLDSAKNTISNMKAQIASLQRDIEEQKRITEQKLSEQKRESEKTQELAVERAVIQAEKAMQEEIALLRDEKVRLQVKIEMLQDTESEN